MYQYFMNNKLLMSREEAMFYFEHGFDIVITYKDMVATHGYLHTTTDAHNTFKDAEDSLAEEWRGGGCL